MKHILLGVLFILCLLGLNSPTNAQLVGPKLDLTVSGNTITATLSGVPIQTKSGFKYVIDTKEITSIPTSIDEQKIILDLQEFSNPLKTPVNGTVSWTIPELKGDTLYHIRIVEIPILPAAKKFASINTSIKTGSAGEIFFKQPDFKKISSGVYNISGLIDPVKHKVGTAIPLSSITVSAGFYDQKTKDLVLQLNPAKPDDEKGNYEFLINDSNLNQNTFYDLKMSFDSTTNVHSEHTYSVDTGKGYIVPETGKAKDDFFDKNSYRLLAPIPGMTALLDPALCQSEQYKNPGVICDINAFLNFLLSLAIGAAAVVLVVRIIISGYGYMVSDIPFIKAKLKGNFTEAMIGLVVALSAYLILNTINPRLVKNDVSIGVAEFEVNSIEDLGIDTNVINPTGGVVSGDIKKTLEKMVFPPGVICPGKTGGSADVRAVALSFLNKVTYNNNPDVRGTPGPNGTVYLDCSLYTNVVLGCAGITPKSAPSTYAMLPKSESVNSVEVKNNKGYVNGKEIFPGDLIGINAPGKGHHVWIYIGNGEIIDSQVGPNPITKKPFYIGSPGKSVIKIKKLELKPYSALGSMNFLLKK